jgi:putative flippase GtrA
LFLITVLEKEGNSIMKSEKGTKRYLLLTAAATPLNFVLFATLVRLTPWPPVVCNLFSATLLTVPTFLVCHYWVWAMAEPQVRRAFLFWVSTLVNVAASSVIVWSFTKFGLSRRATVFVPTATYSVLWWLRFRFLDAVVFRPHANS